ncbi:MAG: thioredoxin-dependent thiol peroxidase [Candidatus Omnitrophica bacterium]|nr:thioredoxin-dependent thiol peroxidase [Candidatus Omnitrophota bacterium]
MPKSAAKETKLKVGQQAPEFTLQNQSEKPVSLKDFKDKWVVLYFYPKDNTPGCTIEAISFTKENPDFKKLDAEILGVSPDSCKSHQKFIAGQKLKITLLSDPDKKILTTYGVWQLKKFMGQEYLGVVRTTLLINPVGQIAHIWTNVKVAGHVEEVKAKLKELKK